MAWTTPRTWTTGELVTASIMNTHVRDNFDETGPAVATESGQLIATNAANSLVGRTPSEDTVTTSETTSSTSYTDLATSGPAVSENVSTGGNALVLIRAQMSNDTASEVCRMSVALSGSSTSSAADGRSLGFESDSADQGATIGTFIFYTSLTGGTTTFTAKYRVEGGTGTFLRRQLAVVPIG